MTKTRTRRFLKLTIGTELKTQVVKSIKVRRGPANDNRDFEPVVRKGHSVKPIKIGIGDKGYDDEDNHELLRDELGAKSIIPARYQEVPVWRTRGLYRKEMKRGYSKKTYHQRSKDETVFSVVKRTKGDEVRSVRVKAQNNEIRLRVIAYNAARIVSRASSYLKGFLQSLLAYVCVGLKESRLAYLGAALPILIVSICTRATDNMVSTTLPLLGKYVFGLGTTYGGVATSAYLASSVFASYVVNPRISGDNRRKANISLMGLVVLLCLLLPVSDAVTALILGLAIGFAYGIVYPSIIAATSLVGEIKGERLLALYTLGLSISLILGPFLESYLLTFGYTAVFATFAAISAIAFLASWTIRFRNVPMETWKPSPASTKGIRAGLFMASVFFLPFAAFTAFLPIYTEQVFHTNTAVAYASFIPLFVMSFFTRAYMAARPFSRLKLPILSSFLITVLGIPAMVLVPNLGSFLIVMTLLGIPHGLTYTLSLIVVSRNSSEDERNVAVSRLSAYLSMLSLVIPLTIGYAIGTVGIQISFLFLLVPALCCSLVVVKWYRRFLA